MPGIYGFVKSNALSNADIHTVADQMRLYPHFVQDDMFEDSSIAASRVHLGKIGELSSPSNLGEFSVWVEGEAYNHQEVAIALGLTGNSLANLLLEAEKKNKLELFLNKLDGYFCAAIYDANKQKIKLISDRYGMRMLYWYEKDGTFIWASEVKGILACSGVDKTIDPTTLDCFMELGYLLGEHTWFEHVKLINPATVLIFDIKTKNVRGEYYWKWSEIKSSNLSFEQAVDELGHRFIESVRRRFNPNENIGIALSGGLDSRAIFAAVNHIYPDFRGYAYTFGLPDCDDITIAEQVIDRSKWRHQKFYFDNQNWFAPRFEKIWNTDGMLDMMHMHGGEFIEEIANNIDINLNGYCGDAIFGGSFLNRLKLNTRFSDNLSKAFYKDFYKLTDVNSLLYEINKSEPHLYMNRVRRFTAMGTVNGLVATEQRKPFFDNNCVELIFSLPDEYRLNNNLYSTMLQKFFPKFFKDIPWQKTGQPAGALTNNSRTIPRRVFIKAVGAIKSLLKIKNTEDYTNYSSWIRSPEVSINLIKLLSPSTAAYRDIVNIDYRARFLNPHLRFINVNYSNQILRAATVEIYLRKIHSRALQDIG